MPTKRKSQTEVRPLTPQEEAAIDADQQIMQAAFERIVARMDTRTTKQKRAAARKAIKRRLKSYQAVKSKWTDGSRIRELMAMWEYCKQEEIDVPVEVAKELLMYYILQMEREG